MNTQINGLQHSTWLHICCSVSKVTDLFLTHYQAVNRQLKTETKSYTNGKTETKLQTNIWKTEAKLYRNSWKIETKSDNIWKTETKLYINVVNLLVWKLYTALASTLEALRPPPLKEFQGLPIIWSYETGSNVSAKHMNINFCQPCCFPPFRLSCLDDFFSQLLVRSKGA